MNENNDKARFDTVAKPNWCPGCGNFGIRSAITKAMLKLDLQPHEVVIASGIGCSSKIPHWINVYGLHSLHGRSLPIAAGIKLANGKLVVIAEGGDGDGFSEGMNHFIQACRRNVDITYIVHNNGVFSLTTGQTATTGDQGFVSKSTPFGSIEQPYHPEALAITAGASFVANGFSGDINQLSELIVKAVEHNGFSFLNTYQVCISFNPSKNLKWYKERIYKIEDEQHDSGDKEKALLLALSPGEDRIATGVLYQMEHPSYADFLPQLKNGSLVETNINNVNVSSLMEELI